MRRRAEDPWDDFDVDRFGVFVPAVMGAGLLVSLGTLVHDALHRGRRRGHDRRRRLAALALARQVRSGVPTEGVPPEALRPRPFYAVVAATGLAVCAYVLLGSTFNYLREGGYVSGIAWLWAVSTAAAAAFGYVGAVAGVTLLTGASAPPWARPLLLGTPLTQAPDADTRPDEHPGWQLGTAGGVVAAALGLLTLTVWSAPHQVDDIDRAVGDLVARWPWVDALNWLDPLGDTTVAVLLALFVGLATLRCRLLAATYLGAVAAAIVLGAALRSLVDRPRPPGPLVELGHSFPSGHLVQATLLAGLVPLALLVATRRRWAPAGAGAVLALGAAGSALHRVAEAHHWATDLVGGALLGGLIVVVSWWVVEHGRWHTHCAGCPWATRRCPRRGAGAGRTDARPSAAGAQPGGPAAR